MSNVSYVYPRNPGYPDSPTPPHPPAAPGSELQLAQQGSDRLLQVRAGPGLATLAVAGDHQTAVDLIGQTNRRGYGGSGDMGGIPLGPFPIKLSQGVFRGNPPVSLVSPVSLLVGFPDKAHQRPTRSSSRELFSAVDFRWGSLPAKNG